MTSYNFSIDAYAVSLSAGVLMALATIIMAWPSRRAPGALSLIIFSMGSAWWTACTLLWRLVGTGADQLVWFKLLFAGVVVISPAFLAFALQYTNRGHWITRRTLVLLAIEPVLFNIAVWTDPYHGLVSGGWQGKGHGEFTGGVIFWVHSVYSYTLVGLTHIVLIQGFLRAPPIYRRQSGVIIVGALVPLLGNVLTIFHMSPFPDRDLTPFGLAISAATIGVTLFRRGMFDLMPIARDAVVERMSDGVLVLDSQNRLVDLNPAARVILGIEGENVLGKPAAVAMAAWRGFSDNDPMTLDDFHDEILIRGDRYVDLRITALSGKHAQLGGRLIVLRDITPLKQTATALQYANDRLRQQLIEIEAMQGMLKEQAIRDALTGLYNRRFLEETLVLELGRSARTHNPVSVVMIDLDYFKRINDTHGHRAGDLLLQAMGNLLLLNCRSGDVACRFGGEEFVVILPGVAFEVALQRAEQWRQEFMALRILCEKSEISATFSAGVSTFPMHGEDMTSLMNAADVALYAAKGKGRNCVTGAEEVSV